MLANLPVKPGNLVIQGLPLGPAVHECLARHAFEFVVAVLDARNKVRAQMVDTLRQKHTELAEQAAQTVHEGSAFLHPSGAHAVQDQHALLRGRLDGHITHVRTACRFADRFGVESVILDLCAALAVRGHELRGDQTHVVAKCAQPARPVMCTAAGFHRHQARLEADKPAQELLA